MNSPKKVLCVIVTLILLFSSFAAYSSAATRSINGIKIITMPNKTVFEKDKDWIYGLWEISETDSKITSVPSTKISFTHNPCCGRYPERGMIDMSGLSIEVSYTDGTTKIMEYAEALNSKGILTPNILASPKGGKDYFIGTNTIEVYLAENTRYYDSYTIEITEVAVKKLSSEKAVIDYNSGYIKGLDPRMTLSMLQNDYFDYGSASVTFSKANKSSKYYGSGSTLTATYPDGTTDVFTFVISGDVDGNGSINQNDAGFVAMAVNDISIMSDVQKLAAEVDGVRRITINDAAVISRMAEE